MHIASVYLHITVYIFNILNNYPETFCDSSNIQLYTASFPSPCRVNAGAAVQHHRHLLRSPIYSRGRLFKKVMSTCSNMHPLSHTFARIMQLQLLCPFAPRT